MAIVIAMEFVLACREAECLLHIAAVHKTLLYFATASHWHYLRQLFVFLMKIAKVLEKLLGKFLSGQHVMQHGSGLWNSTLSDQMLDNTVIPFKEKLLDCRTKRLYISS